MTAAEIATQAEELKVAYRAFNMTFVPLLDPRLPLLSLSLSLSLERPLRDTAYGPFRNRAKRRVGPLKHCRGKRLQRGCVIEARRAWPGPPELHGYARRNPPRRFPEAGRARQGRPTARVCSHLRNACAHGNRWHFKGTEPSRPASLRRRTLDASLHGSQAIPDWLGPGDYLDYLDDLAGLLRGLPST